MRKISYSIVYLICALLSSVYAQENTRFAFLIPKSPDALYLGAVLKKDALLGEEHQPINLTITKKMPAFFLDASFDVDQIEGTKIAYEAYLKKFMPELVRINPVQDIYFKTHSIKKKADLESIFGTKTDVTSWFGVDIDQAVGKNYILMDFGITYFHVSTDMLYEDWTKISSLKAADLDNHLYVNGIGYGKRFLILVESASSEQELKNIIERFFFDKPITATDKTILANSSFHALTFGKDAIAPDKENPVKAYVDYLKKPFTKEDYGTPVYMVLFDLENQLYYNEIK